MATLSPTTLTQAEQRAILKATAKHPRDHLIFSLALGTGLRLAELIGLNVGDVYAPDGTPKARVRIRAEIAKGPSNGSAGCCASTSEPLRRRPTTHWIDCNGRRPRIWTLRPRVE